MKIVLCMLTAWLCLSNSVQASDKALKKKNEELQAQITVLLAQISALQSQHETMQAELARVPSSLFGSFDLVVGSEGEVVRDLQRYLNLNGYPIAAHGNGSRGQESTYFGIRTKNALSQWQKAQSIPATGHLDYRTRLKLADLFHAHQKIPLK